MEIPFVDLKSQYQALKPQIDARIHRVLEHGAYINGPEVAELESKLSEYTGAKYTLACASGTDALLIPMMAMGIGPGDEVITTAFSFIATAETIVLAGAKPIYVDIDPVTFNLDEKLIEKYITPRTKAIAPVSLYGQTPDMDMINQIAKKHNLFVIEDAAQSFGAKFKGKRSGNLSLASGTSFFPAKPLGGYGDGGAIFTADEKLYKIMKEIREHGSESRYYHTRLGLNGRLDTIQCAILLAKLERYDWEMKARQKVADRYNQAFEKIKMKNFRTPQVLSDRESAWAQYTLTLENRSAFQSKMNEVKIPTSIHYPRIMPEQPWYQGQTQQNASEFPHAKWAADHVISLPMFPDMKEEMQDYIIQHVLKALT